MRNLALIILIAALFASCEKEQANPVKEYGNALIDSKRQAEAEADASVTRALIHSAEMYRAENGNFPDSLETLSGFAHIEADGEKFSYDPKTGRVAKKR